MAPLKKRGQFTFLDDSSSDEEDTNIVNSDDFASESSDYDDDDDEKRKSNQQTRNAQKSTTPKMMDSPSLDNDGNESDEDVDAADFVNEGEEGDDNYYDDDDDDDDALMRMNTQEPSPKAKKRSRETNSPFVGDELAKLPPIEKTESISKKADVQSPSPHGSLVQNLEEYDRNENNVMKPKTTSKLKLKTKRSKKDRNTSRSLQTNTIQNIEETEKASSLPKEVETLTVIVDKKVFVNDVAPQKHEGGGESSTQAIVLDSDDDHDDEKDFESRKMNSSSTTSKRKSNGIEEHSSDDKTSSTTNNNKRRKRHQKSDRKEDDIFEKSSTDDIEDKPKTKEKENQSKKNAQNNLPSKPETVSDQSMTRQPPTPSIATIAKTANQSTVPKSITKPKPKKKQTFQTQVLIHLLKTLRPFTLKSLAAELRTTTTALNHLMLSMLDKKIVQKKEWGKHKNKDLYYIDIENAIKEAYGKDYRVDSKAKEDARNELNSLTREQMRIASEMNATNMQISNEELEKQLEAQEKIVSDMRTRINGAKERISNSQQTTHKPSRPTQQQYPRFNNQYNQQKPKLQSTKQIKKEFNDMRNEWKSRKEKCVDFIDNLSDAMEKRPKDIIKLLDLETDESIGVKLPPKMDMT